MENNDFFRLINQLLKMGIFGKLFSRRKAPQAYPCGDLSKGVGKCSLADCVEETVGLKSNSVSMTDTWLLTFNDGVRYNGVPVKKGFVKLWTDDTKALRDSYLFNSIDQMQQQEYLVSVYRLIYEEQIYREVIRPLIDANVAPVFVRHLTSGRGCSLSNMASFIKLDESIETKEMRVMENVKSIILGDGFHLPVTDSELLSRSDDLFGLSQTDDKIQYSYIVTEAFKGPTFREWAAKLWGNSADAGLKGRGLISGPDTSLFNDSVDDPYGEGEFWEVLLQVYMGCYAMGLSLTTHNDLHSDNVFIQDLGTRQPTLYVIEGECYHFNTRWRPLIYDFDRSFSMRVGFNQLEDDDPYLQRNAVVTKKDMFQIACFLSKREISEDYITKESGNIPVRVQKEIRSVLTDDDKMMKQMMDWCHMRVGGLETFGRDSFDSMRSPIDIIRRVAEHATDLVGISKSGENDPAVAIENVYVCNSDMFTESGQLRSDIIENEQNLVKNWEKCYSDFRRVESIPEDLSKSEPIASYQEEQQVEPSATTPMRSLPSNRDLSVVETDYNPLA